MKISYHLILNKTFKSSMSLKIHGEIYQLWKGQWERLYSEQGSSHTPTADDFTRHDLFAALMHRGHVIGFSAHTFLDFKDITTYHRNYFEMFGESYVKKLQAMNINRVMTFESLIVRPEYQHNPLKLPLGRTLIRINSYLLEQTTADAIMAVTRKDNNVSTNSEKLGYRIIEADKLCRGFPCDLRALIRGEHLKKIDDVVEPHAGNLWQSKAIHIGEPYFVGEGYETIKRAA